MQSSSMLGWRVTFSTEYSTQKTAAEQTLAGSEVVSQEASGGKVAQAQGQLSTKVLCSRECAGESGHQQRRKRGWSLNGKWGRWIRRVRCEELQEIILGLVKHFDFGLDSGSELESHLYCLLGDTRQAPYFSGHQSPHL